jgi:hypothetical protein
MLIALELIPSRRGIEMILSPIFPYTKRYDRNAIDDNMISIL